MKAALGNQDCAIFNFVDEPVFLGDSSGPPAGQVFFQKFWLADAAMRITANVPDQVIYFFKASRVLRFPPIIIV